MSCDFGVWFADRKFTDAEADGVYTRLCEGGAAGVTPHPAILAFYQELTALHPELDDVPEERIDDTDYCPWSCAMDRSPAHVILSCVWSHADHVRDLLVRLTAKHGLTLYDPQTGKIIRPDEVPALVEKKPWWRFWR